MLELVNSCPSKKELENNYQVKEDFKIENVYCDFNCKNYIKKSKFNTHIITITNTLLTLFVRK